MTVIFIGDLLCVHTGVWRSRTMLEVDRDRDGESCWTFRVECWSWEVMFPSQPGFPRMLRSWLSVPAPGTKIRGLCWVSTAKLNLPWLFLLVWVSPHFILLFLVNLGLQDCVLVFMGGSMKHTNAKPGPHFVWEKLRFSSVNSAHCHRDSAFAHCFWNIEYMVCEGMTSNLNHDMDNEWVWISSTCIYWHLIFVFCHPCGSLIL